MENYVIVKGSNDLLDREGKELFVGLRKNKFGFEGLAKDKQAIIDWFGNEVVLEKPTLDDIIVYTAKGRGAYASPFIKICSFSGDVVSVFNYAVCIIYVRPKC